MCAEPPKDYNIDVIYKDLIQYQFILFLKPTDKKIVN